MDVRHQDTEALATSLRLRILNLCHNNNASHIGGAYSIIDVLVVLYLRIASVDAANPSCASRDRVFYSKGHACTALYCILEVLGFFSNLDQSFSKDGAHFTTHVNHKIPGVELSTGISVAAGTALSAKRKRDRWRTFVVISDGKLDESSNLGINTICTVPQTGQPRTCRRLQQDTELRIGFRTLCEAFQPR
jgi:transketolase